MNISKFCIEILRKFSPKSDQNNINKNIMTASSKNSKKTKILANKTTSTQQNQENEWLTTVTSILKGENVANTIVNCEIALNGLLGSEIDQHSNWGMIIYASKVYFAENLFQSIINYAKQGINIAVVVDRTVKENKKTFDAIKNLKDYRNIKIFYFSRAVKATDRIRIALNVINSEYVLLFTSLDQINVRSVGVYIDSHLQELGKINIFKTMPNTEGPFFESLCGILYRKDILTDFIKQIPGRDFFLKSLLDKYIRQKNIKLEEILDTQLWTIKNRKEISIPDIAYLFKEAIDKDDILFETILDATKRIVDLNGISDTKKYIVASCVAIYLAHKNLSDNEIEKFSAVFNFDQDLKNNKLHVIHRKIVESIIPEENKTIAIVETRYMEDLKSRFLEKCREFYNVIYLSKPQYYDYHFLNCMVMRAKLQKAKLVIASNDMHKYITSGKKVLVLWHGLGMLKKIAEVDRVKYPMDWIVTSSKGCVEEWSKTFKLNIENVLPFGTVQTDILFDKTYLIKRREEIKKRYFIPDGAKVVVFAPTFRNSIQNQKYYNFGMNIDDFAKDLAKENVFIIAKKHHVFKHILKDKGYDASGLVNSENGHFIVDNYYEFIDLLCVADIFMTDYSSALFYAILRNLPIILYAPDIDAYINSANGLMIKYPDDIPAFSVQRANKEDLLEAIRKCKEGRVKDFYEDFKELHIGMCDGHSTERVLNWIHSNLKEKI